MLSKYPNIETYFNSTEHNFKRLNLGCGARLIEDYCNVDANVGNDDDHRGGHFIPDCIESAENINCPDNFFDEILAQHIFEHFTYNECRNVLLELFRVLRPGGILIIETPDARRLTIFEALIPETFRKPVSNASTVVPFKVDVIKSQRYGAFWEQVPELYPLHLFVWQRADLIKFSSALGFQLILATSATLSHVPFRDFCLCLRKPGDNSKIQNEILKRYGNWYAKLKRNVAGFLTILNLR